MTWTGAPPSVELLNAGVSGDRIVGHDPRAAPNEANPEPQRWRLAEVVRTGLEGQTEECDPRAAEWPAVGSLRLLDQPVGLLVVGARDCIDHARLNP